jgi:hypothetical protein
MEVENEMVTPAGAAVTEALVAGHRGAWALLSALARRGGDADADTPHIQAELGRAIVRRTYYYEAADDDLLRIRRLVHQKLAAAGLSYDTPPTELDHIAEKVNRIAGWLASMAT